MADIYEVRTSLLILKRSIKQTTSLLALASLIALLLATVGVSAASAAGLCTRVDNGDGTVTLTWDADGDAKWSIRVGTPGNSGSGVVIRNNPTYTGGDVANDYVVRYVRQNNVEVACTTAPPPPPPPPPGGDACSVVLLGNGNVVLTVEDNGANSYGWRRGRNGAATSYKGEVQNLSVTDVSPASGTYEYQIVSRFGDGARQTDDCGSVTIEGGGGEPVANNCSATLNNNGSVTVTWDNNGANTFSVRRGLNGAAAKFIASGQNFTYTDTNPPQGSVEYVIRALFGGDRIDASCGTVTVGGNGGGPLVCTLTDNGNGTVSVDWNDDGANKWSIRRGRNNGTINFKGQTETPGWTSQVESGSSYTWQVISLLPGGGKTTTDCGSLTIGGGAGLVCTLTDNGNGTVSVDWTDDGANKWSVRRGRNNGNISYRGETETPGWTSQVDAGNSYTWELVSRFQGGAKTTTSCGTLAV